MDFGITWNDQEFNQKMSNLSAFISSIWNNIIEYTCVAYTKVLGTRYNLKDIKTKALDLFDTIWAYQTFIYIQEGMLVHWDMF